MTIAVDLGRKATEQTKTNRDSIEFLLLWPESELTQWREQGPNVNFYRNLNIAYHNMERGQDVAGWDGKRCVCVGGGGRGDRNVALPH